MFDVKQFPDVQPKILNESKKQIDPELESYQGIKLTFFPGSHLARKHFKVVANSKKLVAIMTHTHTKNTSHASINFLAKRDEK